MALDPSTLLQEAIRAVPAVKYALGIAGVLAVVAIARAFGLDPAFAIGGTIVMLTLMVVLLVFAKLSASASRHFVAPALFLTWGALGLVLASAGMLFSSAFFGRPIDLRPGAGAEIRAVDAKPPASASGIAGLVELQLDAGDYAGAWTALGDARARGDRAELDELEVRVAEAWVRDMHAADGQTFTSLVDPLMPVLYRGAQSQDTQAAADALAHIGFASFLKNRDGAAQLDVEASYRKALDLDPGNPYANVMLGHWLLVSGKPISAASPRFEKALASGRERSFVRQYQIAALLWNHDTDAALALLRACNEMRQKGELLDLETRRRIATELYFAQVRELGDALETALPPKEHLATFRWLVEDIDVSASAYLQFALARLSEAADNCAAALQIYEQLQRSDTTFAESIEAGIARCRKVSGAAAP